MLKVLCTVYDLKAQTYSNPFVSTNTATAIRDFTQAVNDPTTQLNKFPADFTLFEIAEFDDVTGFIKEYDHPLALGLAHQFMDNERNYDVRS